MAISRASFNRVISLIICIIMVAGIMVAGVDFSASAATSMSVVAGKAVETSSGAFLQAYISIEKGVSTNVTFHKAIGYDVYGFYGYYGGNALNVKSDESERHLGGTDKDYYMTWSSDLSTNPYQAFEADVSGVSGEVILGYDGMVNSDDADGKLIMQLWNPNTSMYEQVDESATVNGVIGLKATANVAQYSENGRIRFRVVLPEKADYKWIITKNATAGKVDESVSYGGSKTRTSSGNSSYNYKGEITHDMFFALKLEASGETYYSMVYPFKGDNNTQNQLTHFNVNFNGDAGTTRNMSWVSKNEYEKAVVQVVPYGKLNPDFSNATEYFGQMTKMKNVDKPYSYYVTVGGLEPNHEYWYRYGNGESVWSSPCYLYTDDGDGDFSFIMSGDPQSYTDSTVEATINKYFGQYKQVGYSYNEAVRIADAEFLVVAGDETDHGDYEDCWDWYFDSSKTFFRSSTLATTMGNHDSWGWDHWICNHNITDPVTGERGSFYSFDYGNAHFIVLNGNISEAMNKKALRDAEYKWLEEDLEAHKDADFKFIIEHHGMYSYPVHTYEDDTVEIRSMLVPLIDKYGVDVMMQGHDHVWLRTDSMKGGKKVENSSTITDAVTGDTYVVDPRGTTYINGGSLTGSKYHDPNPASFLDLISIACAGQPKLPSFNTFEIEGGKLKIKGWVVKKDGSLGRIGDYFTYGSEKDGYNIIKTSYYTKLNDRINALPETLTLSDREEVLAIKKACDIESNTILDAYVPDADKIESAYQTVEQLWRDSCVPEIEVDDGMPTEFKTGIEYSFPKATAYDENDGSLPVSLAIIKGENREVLEGKTYTFAETGSYTVEYSAVDKDGHTTKVTYDITVKNGVADGDLDEDGEITVTDALMVLRFAAKLANPTPAQLKLSDMDKDTEVTVTDALMVLRIAAKLV